MLEKPIVDTKSYVDGQPTSPVYVPQGGDQPKTDPAPKQPAPAKPQPAPAGQAAPITSIIPDEFKGSTYGELEEYLRGKMAEHKPLSEEELKKIRRRQKAEKIISSIADASMAITNLVATSQYAPNMYNGADSMTAKAQARFDKEKAEREAEDDKFYNYALMLGKARGEDRDRALDVWKSEQTLARQDRAHDESRQDRADDVAFRDKSWDESVRQWQENFDRQGEWHEDEVAFRDKQFKESVRQFNVQSSLERQRISISAQQLALQAKQGQMTFNLGSGHGNVTLTLDQLNAQTVSRIYSTLPANVRSQVQGDPIVQNGLVVGYKPPTTEAMLIAIGANVENCPATQNAIRQVAGLEKGNKPKAY